MLIEPDTQYSPHDSASQFWTVAAGLVQRPRISPGL